MSTVNVRTVTTESEPTTNGESPRTNSYPVNNFEGIFEGYGKRGSYAKAYDEMFESGGAVRVPYRGIYAELAPCDASELSARS
ncbi:MAG TPA: hypothetical protein VEH31_13790, partial [Streptosporangiaceae bacterium]|nr:hypothetical protein [Streptosporangiaceae bacterium]